MKRAGRAAVNENGAWLMGVPAIVADNADPERQHRVKLIIPSIDDAMVYDEWARQMVFCLGNGFGSSFIPPKGSEVVVFGQLGQKHNLFYASLYNEEMTVPPDMDSERSVGFRAPAALTAIATTLLKLLGQNILAEAEQLATFKGNNADVIAAATARVNGADVQVTASNQLSINGATVTINSNGSVTIHGGGNVAVSASGTLTLEGRTVNKSGPSI
ncbi:MAG: hypothetical protein IT171_08510 [Acidobacteria bacterium]|nr:hypothetical protein [Acidobacteriota bacterium]